MANMSSALAGQISALINKYDSTAVATLRETIRSTKEKYPAEVTAFSTNWNYIDKIVREELNRPVAKPGGPKFKVGDMVVITRPEKYHDVITTPLKVTHIDEPFFQKGYTYSVANPVTNNFAGHFPEFHLELAKTAGNRKRTQRNKKTKKY